MANSEAIAWYVEEGRRLLEDQQRRAESLRARGGQIAGFGAVFLALIGGNAARILHESHGAGRTEIGVALIIGALGLVTSVAVAVVGVIQPRSYGTIAAREIATYRSDRFLNEPELWRVQVRSLRTLERATVEAQRNGNAAGKAMNTRSTPSSAAFCSR
jgi:hypothetical protein